MITTTSHIVNTRPTIGRSVKNLTKDLPSSGFAIGTGIGLVAVVPIPNRFLSLIHNLGQTCCTIKFNIYMKTDIKIEDYDENRNRWISIDLRRRFVCCGGYLGRWRRSSSREGERDRRIRRRLVWLIPRETLFSI